MMLDLGDVSAYGIVVLTATLTWIVRLVVFGDPGLLHWFGLPPYLSGSRCGKLGPSATRSVSI